MPGEHCEQESSHSDPTCDREYAKLFWRSVSESECLRKSELRGETMLGERTAGWTIGIVLVISTSVAHGQSAGEASVRLNGVPVIQVTASGNESATARAARIERRLERLADRVDETARPAVVRGPRTTPASCSCGTHRS